MAELALQLRQLQQKNEQLLAALQAKEQEVKELQSLAETVAEAQSQDCQAAKVIDLAKKNRALNLALEREKQKAARLLSDVMLGAGAAVTATPGSSGVAEEAARLMVEQAAEAVEAAQREAAAFKERMQQQTNKLAQVEQKAFNLEIENKKLLRALQREVGEDVPVAKLLEESSDWKGRREQLIALKDQVRQLKAASGQVPESRRETAAKAAISKLSKERTLEQERLASELAASRQELDSLRVKYEGAVNRRKILESELLGMKEKVALVLEKANNDSKLISALREEITKFKKGSSRASSAGRNACEESEEVWQQVSMLTKKCKQQEEQLDRQEQIIFALQDQHEKGRAQGRDSPLEQQLRLAEVENSRLQELIQLLQSRLQQ